MGVKSKPREPLRRTLFDDLDQIQAKRNLFCRADDLSNEASVESFFVGRLLENLGFADSQILTKKAIESKTVSRGRKRERYRPDYVLQVSKAPRVVLDAKGTDEDPAAWAWQCASYSLLLNQQFPSTNPVRYYVLTNGLKTLVYQWDSEVPILELDFADFEWGNERFESFRNLLSAGAVTTSNAEALAATQRHDFKLIRPTSAKARQVFAQCHKAIWKAEVCSPSAAFLAFVKVMFVKLWADRALRTDAETKKYFAGGGDEETALPGSAVWFSLRWIEEREKDGVTNPLDTIRFARLREDIELEIEEKRKKRIFGQGEQIGLRPDTIKDVVRRLQHYDMFGIDEDLNGRLFETFLSATMRGRELGQFFTPRSVVKTMTLIAGLKANRDVQHTVLDACCGSGGFLIEALTIMRNEVRDNDSLSLDEKERLIARISNECLYGIDAGKDPPLARIARINMYLHGDGGSHIYYADALDKDVQPPDHGDREEISDLKELRETLARPLLFDAVLTNPPFSMTKESRNAAEGRILKQYLLAKRGAKLRPSLRSSVMFAERYWDVLKPGGLLVTVADDTLLASSQFEEFRTFLRDHFLVRAIISLPGDTFRRQGSRVKTSVLVLAKKRNASEQQPACFYHFAEHLGVDDLTPRAPDAEVHAARERAEGEMEKIVNGFNGYLSGKAHPNILKADRLQDRLDLKFCVGEFGRMAEAWRGRGVEVRPLSDCVTVQETVVKPKSHRDTMFSLIKVTYAGRCELDVKKLGKTIKPKSMLQVGTGDLVFSTIRATDGAIGIVPPELDGALVSDTSYVVFRCASPEDTAYLWAILRSHEVRADMQSLSPGSGRYTTRWPDVGTVLVPWLATKDRNEVGAGLIRSWQMERAVEQERLTAMRGIEALGVESDESKRRFMASKAPT